MVLCVDGQWSQWRHQNRSFLVIVELDHFQDHVTPDPDPHNWLYWVTGVAIRISWW